MKYYTGVGSRETPPAVLDQMVLIARNLAVRGYTLRSGGADGADSAFEAGASDADIFLPWKGFNKHKSHLCAPGPKAMKMAESIHPAWNKLSDAAKRLHARNCYQVLGPHLTEPSEFLICWTARGWPQGGTRTAIVLAEQWNIPVWNLGRREPIYFLPQV